MVDPDVLARKSHQILHHCDRLQQRRGLSTAALDADEDLANIVLMDLQQAIQATIDLAVHVCVDESLGAPAQSAQAFDLLQKAGVIELALAVRLTGAVGVRNLIVHQYTDVDYSRITAIMNGGLDDLRRFAAILHQRA